MQDARQWRRASRGGWGGGWGCVEADDGGEGWVEDNRKSGERWGMRNAERSVEEEGRWSSFLAAAGELGTGDT